MLEFLDYLRYYKLLKRNLPHKFSYYHKQIEPENFKFKIEFKKCNFTHEIVKEG